MLKVQIKIGSNENFFRKSEFHVYVTIQSWCLFLVNVSLTVDSYIDPQAPVDWAIKIGDKIIVVTEAKGGSY